MLLVETRLLGRKRPLDDWSIEFPPASSSGEGGDGSLTLRDLIERVVRAEVAAFERRQKQNRLVRVLSEREIAESAARGKVVPGGREPGASVDADTAVAAALEGFEDGLYLVILDGEEQRELERQVFVRDDSRLVFLRLAFLAGA